MLPVNPIRKTFASPVTDAFKDTTGRWRTISLFIEFADPAYPAFFTLSDEDDPVTGAVSLRKKYLEYGDVTEYTFALKMFGSWHPWARMCDSLKLAPYIEMWRAELRKRLESEALNSIKAIAADPNHNHQLAASKYLIEYLKPPKRAKPLKVPDVPITVGPTSSPSIPWDTDFDRIFKPRSVPVDETPSDK